MINGPHIQTRLHMRHSFYIRLRVVRRAFRLGRLLVSKHKYYPLVLSVQSINVLKVPIRSLRVEQIYNLGRRSDIFPKMTPKLLTGTMAMLNDIQIR